MQVAQAVVLNLVELMSRLPRSESPGCCDTFFRKEFVCIYSSHSLESLPPRAIKLSKQSFTPVSSAIPENDLIY